LFRGTFWFRVLCYFLFEQGLSANDKIAPVLDFQALIPFGMIRAMEDPSP
jgi:hypothetical protein